MTTMAKTPGPGFRIDGVDFETEFAHEVKPSTGTSLIEEFGIDFA